MATIAGRITVSQSFSQTLSTLPATAGTYPVVAAPINASCSLAAGTAADQADLKYTATLSFAAAAQVLNLQSLTDVTGAAVNFARVRSITFKMRGAADNNILKVGYSGVTSNAWTSLVSNPGQIFLQAYSTSSNDAVAVIAAPGATGYTVGASNRLLNLDPGAATFTCDIEIVGASV